MDPRRMAILLLVAALAIGGGCSSSRDEVALGDYYRPAVSAFPSASWVPLSLASGSTRGHGEPIVTPIRSARGEIATFRLSRGRIAPLLGPQGSPVSMSDLVGVLEAVRAADRERESDTDLPIRPRRH